MKGIVAKGLWFLGLAVVGALTLAVQADYFSRYRYGLADWVPAPFKAVAIEVQANEAMAAGQTDLAIALSRELIRKRPIPSEGYSLLGYAAALKGQDDLAGRALVVAARRGWRDRRAQFAMVNFALAGGDVTVAAQRLAALWSTGGLDDQTAGLTNAVLANAAARRAFSRVLAGNPPWMDDFLTWGAGNAPPEAFLAVVKGARHEGAKFDCPTQAAATQKLLSKGAAGAAQQLWEASCGKGGASGGFAFPLPLPDGRPGGPFDWAYPHDGNLTRRFDGTAPSVSIHYANSGGIFLALASKFAVLAGGKHSIRARFSGEPPQVRISCQVPVGEDGQAFKLRLTLSPMPQAFVLPATDCPSQNVEVFVPRGKGMLAAVIVE